MKITLTDGKTNNTSKQGILLVVVIGMLLALWIPVVIDKTFNFGDYRVGILNQPFPNRIAHPLVWTLLALELTTIALLIIGGKALRWGMWLSALLMLAFTVYIANAYMGDWEKEYCGCGAVISKLSWGWHFWFNLFFLAVSAVGIYIEKLYRSGNAGGDATEGGSAKRQDI